ncbi:MAG: ferritin family protein [Candidatus Adiutrix sp.]|jgi:rubrerythrin|nr:ferritin family protein [Candidatus Adiutrix sp.]
MIFPFNAGEVFKIAITIEDNGRLFYQKAAAKPFPEEIVSLFTHLTDEELAHKAFFQEILKSLPPSETGATVWDPDNELDKYLKLMADQHVFNQAPEAINSLLDKVSTPADAIRLAMGFEKDTIVFFLELQAAAEKYDESREAIGRLVTEERRHMAHLAEMLQRITG